MLSVSNLTWQTEQKTILNSISFELKDQSVNAIVGPNGAGKTSLLRCLYGQINQYSGQVEFLNKPIKSYSAKQLAQQIAVVNQHLPINFALSVYEIVCLGLIPHLSLFSQISPSQQTFIEQILNQLEIQHLRDRHFNQLSGGEQQRVLIARALAQKPKLLILDEPTNHLDIHFQHQILNFICSLNVCILMTVHDLNLASYYADHILLMNQGQLIASGTAQAVLTPKLIADVFKLPVELGLNPLNQKQHVYFAASDIAKQFTPAAVTQAEINKAGC
ncbi:ABC transporter ATP-binding protein [Catenovulum sp. 2E275]|uniref:ABC transporter ATP-binding protein n=1 Tax=Catenovulum sp. 2E275 TaxID=2980497 RepID=UPI0021D0110A|nr:ABC transporter ATP-binding protein [Catenovulum sp. 2E275]MCU4674645.1 ABC transporter ATP-binding protein [Catenovulum sp. 2E275]